MIRNDACRLCALGQEEPDRTCWMRSPLQQCDVMVVAEGPMHYDVTYDSEFAGKGLKEVKAFLEKNGIKAHYTYATKCPKPNKDFKIKPAFVKVCSTEYLQKEIEEVRPKHIIVLGANAMYGAWKKQGITEKSGNRHWDEKYQAHFYPTVHQAQAVYNQERKEELFRDLERFVQWIGGEAENQPVLFEPPVYVASTLKSLRKLRRLIKESGGTVAVDTETSGLNQYTKDFRVRSIQFCFDAEFGGVFVPLDLERECYYEEPGEDGKVVRTRAEFWQDGETLEEAVKIIRQILLESKVIWHNGKYDRIALYMWGKRLFRRPILAPFILMDTMHVAHLLDENRRLGLKKLITSELGYPSYDIGDKLTKNLSLLIPYATRDTVACLLLAKKYATALAEPSMLKIRRFYRKVIRRIDSVFTSIELRGWPVNLQRTLDAKASIEEKLVVVEAAMQKALRNAGLAEVTDNTFGSPQKLAPLIFERLGYRPTSNKLLALNDTEGLSTSEDALVHLKDKPFISELLEWRGLMKALSTYVEPMIRAAQNRGKITTSYKITGTVTGRTASGKEGKGKSANGMNLQNIPPTHGIKACVMPEDPDFVVLNCDFSQIELRIAGEFSGDKALNWAYRNDVDLHTFRAMRVVGVDEDGWNTLDKATQKKHRTNAKPVNFGFLYGMHVPKFVQFALTDYGISFTFGQGKALRAGFQRDHAGLVNWYAKQEEEAKTFGYVESLSGRRRHLPNIKLDPGASKEARSKYNDAVRQAINTPVQGFASDLKLMSLIEIDDYLTEKIGEDLAYLIGEVHDSVIIIVHKDYAERVAKKVLSIMRKPKLLEELGIEVKIPIDAEAEIGPSLGETEEFKVAA